MATPTTADKDAARPPARRGEGTRETIDAAAVDRFARLGYHAASVRAIAAEAGIQPAAIYHWYENKEALLFRLQIQFMDQLEERVFAAVEARPTPALNLAPPSASTSITTACTPRLRSSPTPRFAP